MGQIHDFSAIANHCVVVQRDVPANDALRSDPALLANRGAVADQCLLADLHIVVNDRVWPNRGVWADNHASLERRPAGSRARALWLLAYISSREDLYPIANHNAGF